MIMKKRWITLLLIATLTIIISACAGEDDDNATPDNTAEEEDGTENNEEASDEEDESDDEASDDEINVTLQDTDGEDVAEATLEEVEDGVKVTLTGEDFSDGDTKHAFHVHEKGICEPDDFESAGGHYNPTDKNHGKEDVDGPHAGDFDNIEVNPEGEIDEEFVTDQISLDEDAENSVYHEDGTSLVIHADEDDYKSQPAGDAGDRIACGVIVEPK